MSSGTTDQFVATKDTPAPLDPAYAYDAGAWNVLRQTVQTLMHAPRGGGEPVPDAAETCSFTDTASESYRCKLRSGLKFADGTPVTAEDVKFSIQRVLDIKADNGPAALLSNIDTIETKGGDEVVFHLATPDATFPYKLVDAGRRHRQQGQVPGKNAARGLPGRRSGPYTMKTEVKDDQIVKVVFTKNPNYKGDLKLRNDKVELRSFADADAMGKALECGDIDMMTRTMSPEQIKRCSESPKDGHRAHRDARPRDPLPRLQHRRPVGEEQGRPAGHGRRSSTAVSSSGKVYGTHRRAALLARSRPASPATPTRSSTSTASRAATRPRRSCATPASPRR